MVTERQVQAALRELVSGEDPRAVADKARVHLATIYRILNKKAYRARIHTISALVEAYGFTLHDFFRRIDGRDLSSSSISSTVPIRSTEDTTHVSGSAPIPPSDVEMLILGASSAIVSAIDRATERIIAAYENREQDAGSGAKLPRENARTRRLS